MTFLQNPFQKKFLPVLVAAALGVAAFAITGGVQALIIFGVMAALQFLNADRALNGFYLYGYIALAVMSLTLGTMLLVVGHAVGPSLAAFAVALLPLSILFTRKGNA